MPVTQTRRMIFLPATSAMSLPAVYPGCVRGPWDTHGRPNTEEGMPAQFGSPRSDATLPIQVSIQVHSILYSGEQLPEDVWNERETVVEGYRSVALGGLKRVAVPVGSRHVRSQELDTVTDSTGGD